MPDFAGATTGASRAFAQNARGERMAAAPVPISGAEQLLFVRIHVPGTDDMLTT